MSSRVFGTGRALIAGLLEVAVLLYSLLAVGDLLHNGALEVVATGEDGYVYVWDRKGKLLPGFPVHSDSKYQRMSVPPIEKVRPKKVIALGGFAIVCSFE